MEPTSRWSGPDRRQSHVEREENLAHAHILHWNEDRAFVVDWFIMKTYAVRTSLQRLL